MQLILRSDPMPTKAFVLIVRLQKSRMANSLILHCFVVSPQCSTAVVVGARPMYTAV